MVAAACVALALGVRAYHIGDPPFGYQAPRQFHSALIARWYYLRTQQSVPAWEKQVAHRNAQAEGIVGEPPVMEFIAALGYRVAGGEHLWIPRLLAALFWLGGALALYRIALRLASRNAALFSAAAYLFMPGAIAATRSFQPDPMMVALMLLAILAIVRYDESPSRGRLWLAGLAAGLAVVVKPGIALFAIVGAFLALSVSRQGVRRAVSDARLYLFGALAVLPTAAFVFAGLVLTGFLRGNTNGRLIPKLLGRASYWDGWLHMVDRLVGLTPIVVALFGLVIARGRGRALLIGLWVGYLVYGLTFTYHISTHDYYSLQLVPIVALSLAPVAALVLGKLSRGWLRPRVIVPVAAVIALVAALDGHQLYTRLTNAAAPQEQPAVYESIGQIVHHSQSTLILDDYYGAPVRYYGWLVGAYWPTSSDIGTDAALGDGRMTAEQRLASYWPNGELKRFGPPQYFIVTDVADLPYQPDLQRLLRQFPLVKRTSDYAVYDLLHRLPA